MRRIIRPSASVEGRIPYVYTLYYGRCSIRAVRSQSGLSCRMGFSALRNRSYFSLNCTNISNTCHIWLVLCQKSANSAISSVWWLKEKWQTLICNKLDFFAFSWLYIDYHFILRVSPLHYTWPCGVYRVYFISPLLFPPDLGEPNLEGPWRLHTVWLR